MNENENGTSVKESEQMPNTQSVLKDNNKNTSIGLTENVGGMLCYFFIIGLIFLFMEKENRFIRFHAMQSVFCAVAVLLISIVLGFMPVIGWVISFLFSPLIFILMIFMMYQAYQGKYFKLPFIGDMAERQLD